jgi:lipid A ethanolaminephosphotransferase
MLKKIFHFIRTKSINARSLSFFSALFIAIFCNTPFWKAVYRSTAGFTSLALLTSMFIVLLAILTTFFHLFAFRYFFKIFLVTIFAINAFVVYFNVYNVVVDDVMIQTVFETNTQEVKNILNIKILLYFILYCLVPSFFIISVKVNYKTFLKESFSKLISTLLLCAIVLVNSVFLFKQYSFFFRQNKYLYLLVPINYISSFIRYEIKAHRQNSSDLIKITDDVKVETQKEKKVIVLVIGETARAANFSLNGYERETNPLLKKESVVSFDNFYSCGTLTAVSVPCIFSHMERKEYVNSDKRYENLLDILNVANVDILWLENDGGCKGVCKRIKYKEDFDPKLKEKLCPEGDCYDEIAFPDLQDKLKDIKKDTLIVFHQRGSHGPTYYKGYPKEFEIFKPTCRTNQFENCSQEEVINTYDNTIIYNDYILKSTIDMLKNLKVQAGMIYVSDHGESLGEKGIYLHGIPYSFAPEEQKRVPFIVWFNRNLYNSLSINQKCLLSRSKNNYSHDNIFHSILSLFKVKTATYKDEFNIFKKC